MSRYNDSSAVKLERFPVERVQVQTEQQQLEVLESKRSERVQKAAVPYGKYAVILACVFAVALGIVASYMQLAAINLENAKLRQEITRLESEENALNAKKEQMYNLTFVEEYAQNELGMVKMEQSDITYVDLSNPETMLVYGDSAATAPAWLSAMGHWLQGVVEYLR